MKKKEDFNQKTQKNMLAFIAQIVTVAVIALFLGSIFFCRYQISGSSMAPLIQDEDIVLINRASFLLGSPKRFDLAYITLDEERKIIKRIIGMPGETVWIEDGRIFIDGTELKSDYLTAYITNGGIASTPLQLGEDEYFVLGDNLPFSEDSRSQAVGVIKRSQLCGRPWCVLYPFGHAGLIK